MKCCAAVYHGKFMRRACKRDGSVERNGKWYCKQHDPVAVRALRQERDARLDAKWAARDSAKAEADVIHDAEREIIEIAKDIAKLRGSFQYIGGLRRAVAKLLKLEQS